MKRSSIIAGIGLFVFIGVVAGGLAMRKSKMMADAASAPAFEPPMSVTIGEARSRAWQPTSELVGTVIALRSVNIQNEIEGVVRFVGFESGDLVEAGQVLVKIDDAADAAELKSEEAALRFAEADVSVVEARVRLAEVEYGMQQAAAESRAAAAIELQRSRAEVERVAAELLRAKASVDEARARISLQQTVLDKHVIRAPFRGRIGLRTVHEGQFLAQPMGSEGSPIATLQEVSDKIYIDFPIPQEHIPRVRIGMVVVGAWDDSGSATEPPATIRLEVAAIDSAVNNETRNLRVRAIVDNPQERLRPGMFVKISVPVEQARDFVVVPVTALRRASYADQVFVISPSEEPGPDGKRAQNLRARQRFVKIGPTVGSDVIVLEGLKVGEQIATSGSFKLRDGALVIPGDAPGAAGGGAPGGGPGGDAGGPGTPPVMDRPKDAGPEASGT